MKPYKIVEESGDAITYEYNPLYAWFMYSVILFYLVGLFARIEILSNLCLGFMLIYFIAKFSLGFRAEKTIRRGVLKHSVTVSGRKASFKNPLRFRVAL